MASESDKYIWSSIVLSLFMEFFNSRISCIVFVSDSETAFLCFEKFFLIICFCFVTIVFFVFAVLIFYILLFVCVV